jgi:diguanylate cyclase (GGDEF)-like protein
LKQEQVLNGFLKFLGIFSHILIIFLLLRPGTDAFVLYNLYLVPLILNLYLFNPVAALLNFILVGLIGLILTFAFHPKIIITLFSFSLVFVLFFRLKQKRTKFLHLQRNKAEKIREECNTLEIEIKKGRLGITGTKAKIKKYQILNEIASTFTYHLKIGEIVDFLVKKVTEIVGNFKCMISFITDKEIIVQSFLGYEKDEVLLKRSLSEIKEIEKWLIEKKLPVVVDNKKADFRFKDTEDKTGSFVGVPFLKGQKVIGLLQMESEVEGAFSQEELRLLSIIANLGTLAIERTRLYEKTQALAIMDGLTETYLHRYFQERLRYDLERARLHHSCFSLVFIDIDYFKECNDKYGHLVGDLVLKNIAEILKKNIRKVDLLARYGGEEFAICVPETTKEGAFALGERIRKMVESQSFTIKNHRLLLTISVGVASYPEDATERQELINKADEALYQAKKTGRNRVCFYQKRGG